MLDSPIDEIKSRLNITDVLSEYVQLKKAGANYKAVCPFHSDKTPSFMVSPVKQIWHCFGCGLGGDIFEFIKQIENVEFAQALRTLADKAGVELKKPTATEIQMQDKKSLLIEINEKAAEYFAKVLWESNAGKEPLEYLRQRGLTDPTIKKWQLGYAPDDYHYLENYLAKKYKKEDIEAAGLIIKRDQVGGRRSEGDQYFDRFHGRIMFPITNFSGSVVGFTGRLLKEKENTGKYVNSPETAIYNKSEVIYGLYQSKAQIRKDNRAILVEGNMDVIACHQAGFNQTVAASGTALTTRQLEVLQRLCENLVFAFDSDSAGTIATRRALELALGLGFSVKIIDLGQAKDPDELIKKGIGIWQKAVDSAPHYVEFFINQLFKQHDPNSVDGKRQITKELVPLIYRISDTITKAHFVRKLSQGINVSEQTIWDLIKKVNLPKAPVAQDKPAIRKDRRTILEEQLLGLSIELKTTEHLKDFAPEDFTEPNRELLRGLQTQETLDTAKLKQKFPNSAQLIDVLTFAAQVEIEEQEQSPAQLIQATAKALLRAMIKRRMEIITGKLAQAEQSQDKEAVKQLSAEFAQLSIKISGIS